MRLHLVLQDVDLALEHLTLLYLLVEVFGGGVDLLLQLPVLLVDGLKALLLRKNSFGLKEDKKITG